MVTPETITDTTQDETILPPEENVTQEPTPEEPTPEEPTPEEPTPEEPTPFLTPEDYRSVCDDYEFETIEAHTDIRRQAEAAALEQISSYTRHRYDMQRAWAMRGDQRNAMIVQCAVNIALWLIIHRLPQSMGHEQRECLYNDSIKYLRDIQAGRATPDLPTYESPDGSDSDTRNPCAYGSNPPLSCTW